MSLETFSPYVRLAHDYLSEPNVTLGPCWILDHALHYFESGRGTYKVEGQDFAIGPGQLFLIRPRTEFSFRAAPGTKLRMHNLHFDLVERPDSRGLPWPYPDGDGQTGRVGLETLPNSPQSDGYLPIQFNFANQNFYETLFWRVHTHFGSDDLAGRLHLKGEMLVLLASLFQFASSEANNLTRQDEVRLQVAVEFMRRHAGVSVALTEVAAASGWSKSHLLDRFKARYGVAPMKWLAKYRLEKAKMELALGDKPIKEIARQAGYKSVHHFSRCFQSHAGTSPAAYRKGVPGRTGLNESRSPPE